MARIGRIALSRKTGTRFDEQSRRRSARQTLRMYPARKSLDPRAQLQITLQLTKKKKLILPAAVRAAQNVDVVVLALGEGSYCETPGNITDLTIGEPQMKLAEAIKATGKPVVLVLVEGRPRIINRIADGASAILMAYNPSNEGGTAIADVLFGDVNPSGKLPFTYPRTPNGLD